MALKQTLIAVAVSLIVTACGGSSNSPAPAPPAPPPPPPPPPPKPVSKVAFKETACNSMLTAAQLTALTSGSSCGFLTVPEKHAIEGQPASEKTIEVAVVKLAARSANKQADPVVYLHGGPGGAGISDYMTEQFSSLLKNRDVYVVDQRGTGLSKPALNCPNYRGKPEQLTACKNALSASGVDFSAYTSLQNAWDFIELRKALKIEQWNIYGESYGTRLATTIMRENEAGIRSVILDGMFPIEVNGISETPWALYETLKQILSNCAQSRGCNRDSLKTRIEAIVRNLQNQGKLKQSRDFIQTLANLAGNENLVGYVHTIAQQPNLIESQDGVDDGSFLAMGLSVVCAEEYPFLDRKGMPDTNEQGWSESTRTAVNGMTHMGFDVASCRIWDVPAASDIETRAVTSNLPVLILNGQNDSQTPAAWGALVAKNMSMSQNFTNPRGEHIQLGTGNSCIASLAEQFLATPTFTLDASCIAAIPPITYIVPAAAAKSASAQSR